MSQPLATLPLITTSRGILLVDFSGQVIICNEMAERLLGLQRADILGKPVKNALADGLFGFSLSKALEEQRLPPFKNEVNGTLNPLYIEALILSKTDVYAPSNQLPVEGLLFLIADAKELQYQQTLAVRNSSINKLNNMAAVVAHEIRNPLGGIMGFASLLQRDLEENSDLHKLASYIIAGTENLSKLVNRVLGYSKPIDITLEPVNLPVLLQEHLLLLNADESINPRIALTLYGDESPIFALANSGALKLVLHNLSINAIQAMPEGGELRFALSESKSEALITITDTGCGIAEDNLNKVFSPFFTTRAEGHGFGLAEVHKMVQAQHGEIELFSEVGTGTTFVIHLIKIESQSGGRNDYR